MCINQFKHQIRAIYEKLFGYSLERTWKPSQKSRTFTSEMIAQFLQLTRSTSWSPNSLLKASGCHKLPFRRLSIPDTNTGWTQSRGDYIQVSAIKLQSVSWAAIIHVLLCHGSATDDSGITLQIVVLTCPCFQHSLKIFQLLLLLGSCRQRSRPSQSQECDVCGSKTLRPITPSLRPPNTPSSLPSEAPVLRPSAFLVSTTEAMMWSRKFGRLLFNLSLWQTKDKFWSPCEEFVLPLV